MTGTSFFISIKSYFQCCCMKRENGDVADKNNTIEHCNGRSPYTFDDLTLPESPIYNSASNSNSSSNWSLSSSFNESVEYNRDYRISPSPSPYNHSVFQPFLSN
jgi:hypothetical protein